jgi:hypothetical protein
MCKWSTSVVQDLGVLEPPRFVGDHASPATPHSDGVCLGKHIISACSLAGAGEPREERYASHIRIVPQRSKSVVEFEGIDKVHGACTCIVCAAVGINVCCKEKLGSINGIKDDIVEEQDFVVSNAFPVDGREGSIADFGEESDALEA